MSDFSKTPFTVGSSPECTYVFSHPCVDKKHLLVIPLSQVEYLIRNISTGGKLLINREEVTMAKVKPGEVIQIGEKRDDLRQIDGITFKIIELIKGKQILCPSGLSSHELKKEYDLSLKEEWLAGASDSDCDIHLPSARVAWRSFKMLRKNSDWEIQPLYGNTKPFIWEKGKILKVGSYDLILESSDRLIRVPASDISMDLDKVDVVVRDEKTKQHLRLAQSVSLSIKSGEFVGIIGPSGAGKSVLLKAMRGLMPIRSGEIRLNHNPVPKNAPVFHPVLKQACFIPQDDVVYPDLTVKENLRFAAKFRLPSDWPDEAIEKKVDYLVQRLDLSSCKNKRVSDISGGQRKRVNLAAEIVMEPAIILADEVCSGLSALDSDNIVRLFRSFADEGKIVILTIHTPDIEALDLMNMLLVYDKGGLVAYYGPARHAMEYFSGEQKNPYRSPKLIFDVLEKADHTNMRKRSPEEWNKIYRSSEHCRQYIENRMGKTCTPDFHENAEKTSAKMQSPGEKEKAVSFESVPKAPLQQVFCLTRRRLLAFYRDKTDRMITLGQAPLMALAFFFVFQKIIQPAGSLQGEIFRHIRNYATPDVIIFLAVLAAVWFGASKSISEIPDAKIFYRQERLSFLNNFAFIFSRFLSLSVITLGQVLLFALTFHIVFVSVPAWLNKSPSVLMSCLFFTFTLLLWLVSVASVATHLFISSLIRSSSAANTILPFLIILQILFGGSRIQPIIKMNDLVFTVSQAMISRWGFEAAALIFEEKMDKPSETMEIIKEGDLKASPTARVKMSFEDLKKTQDERYKKLSQEAVKIVTEKAEMLKDYIPDEEKKYISVLKQNNYQLDSRLPIESSSKLAKEIISQFNGTLDEVIKAVVESEKTGNISDPALWEWMLSVSPKLKLFRACHLSATWIALAVITLISLVLLAVSFKIRDLFSTDLWK